MIRERRGVAAVGAALLGATLGGVGATAFGGCGGTTSDAGSGGDAGAATASDATATEEAGLVDGGGAVTTVSHPDAPPLPGQKECTVTITTGLVPGPATHLALCTPIDYPTNPPCGGPHWGLWAAFGVSENAIPRELYVHDMEHGSVVLAYRCDGACPEVLAALHEVVAKEPADPLCDPTVHDRLVMTPDPLLATPIAAAAWGTTYTATCIDDASLRAFVAAHYAKGPENTCAQGLEPTDAGYTSCDADGGGPQRTGHPG